MVKKQQTKTVEELDRELSILLLRYDFYGERKLGKDIKLLAQMIERLKGGELNEYNKGAAPKNS